MLRGVAPISIRSRRRHRFDSGGTHGGQRVQGDYRKRAEILIEGKLASLTAHQREVISAGLEKLRGALAVED
jgi:hypothetical protein